MAVAAWAALTVAEIDGRLPAKAGYVVYAGPPLLGVIVLLRRVPVPRSLAWAVALAAIFADGALLATRIDTLSTFTVIAAPAALIAAVACSRFPVASLLGLYAVATTFGSLQAFTSVPPGKAAELILAGLWLAVVWRLVIARQRAAIRVVPATVLLGAFIAVVAIQVFVADSLTAGLRTFVSTGLYMSTALLVPLLDLDERQRGRLLRGLVGISVLVAAYAVLRYVIGPAAQERGVGAQQAFNFKDGKLLLIGSFASRHQLGEWSGLAIAACAALAWGLPGRWRVAALATIPLAAVAILGAESRSGLIGAAAGLVAAFLLHSVGRATPGPRLGSIGIAMGGVALTAVVAFAVVGPNSSTYTFLTDPGKDQAYQARQRKWTETVAEIRRVPLGHGLGSANQLQIQGGRFSTIGTYSLDNSYLRVAYEQGVGPALLFVVLLVVMLVTLGAQAVRGVTWTRAGPSMMGASVLAAYVVIMYPSNAFDGFTALIAWLLIGVGLAPVLRAPGDGEGAAA